MKNLNAKASFNPAPVKNETMKNSEIRAKERNKPKVNNPFGAVHLKVKRLRPLDLAILVPSVMLACFFTRFCPKYIT